MPLKTPVKRLGHCINIPWGKQTSTKRIFRVISATFVRPEVRQCQYSLKHRSTKRIFPVISATFVPPKVRQCQTQQTAAQGSLFTSSGKKVSQTPKISKPLQRDPVFPVSGKRVPRTAKPSKPLHRRPFFPRFGEKGTPDGKRVPQTGEGPLFTSSEKK